MTTGAEKKKSAPKKNAHGHGKKGAGAHKSDLDDPTAWPTLGESAEPVTGAEKAEGKDKESKEQGAGKKPKGKGKWVPFKIETTTATDAAHDDSRRRGQHTGCVAVFLYLLSLLSSMCAGALKVRFCRFPVLSPWGVEPYRAHSSFSLSMCVGAHRLRSLPPFSLGLAVCGSPIVGSRIL